MNAATSPPGYYGLPVIHRSHWKWLVIFYFFFGGIAGAAQAIAAVAAARDREGNRDVIRAARYVSLAAFLPCPALLILDLGRPGRFLHMLRILKFRSPMSIGSWTLALFGAAATAVATGQALDDRPSLLPDGIASLARRLLGPASVVAALLGVLLSAYTGVLLAATAVPIWAKRSRLLGPIFVASAMSTAAAAIDIATESRRIALLEGICSATELAVLAAWFARLGSIRRPLAAGRLAPLFRHAVIGAGIAAPFGLRAIGPHMPASARRAIEVMAALLTLVGGFALRYVIVVAGAESADDPAATFALTAAPGSEAGR